MTEYTIYKCDVCGKEFEYEEEAEECEAMHLWNDADWQGKMLFFDEECKQLDPQGKDPDSFADIVGRAHYIIITGGPAFREWLIDIANTDYFDYGALDEITIPACSDVRYGRKPVLLRWTEVGSDGEWQAMGTNFMEMIDIFRNLSK